MDAVDYRHFPGSQFKLIWLMHSSINVTQVADTVLHLQQSRYLFVLIYSFRVELIKFDFINSTWPTPNGKFENFYKLNIFWMQFEWRIIKYMYMLRFYIRVRNWNRLHGCFLRHGWSHWTKQSKSSSFHKEMRNQLLFATFL